MSSAQLEIQLIAVVVAAACALPGVFLVLRRMAMMSDAISHAILPGIVVAFFLTHDLNSPLLILGAALTGVLTVALVEGINHTRLVKEDTAIGLVFPVLFSIGVILIAQFADDVHLDTDAVLLGELAFAPFDRFMVGDYDLGPRSLYIMATILLINTAFIWVFYKELQLATFDAGLSAALGFLPGALHYLLMGLVSVTAVSAFDAVGAILVVAFIIGPPAAAHLLTDHLPRMIGLSVLLGVVSALGGYWLAHVLDASIAGGMATMIGVVFGATVLFAPHRGLLAQRQLRIQQRWTFAQKMLTIHLLQHEGLPEATRENRASHLHEHIQWDVAFGQEVVKRAVSNRFVEQQEDFLSLTDMGRSFAQEAVVET